MENQKKTTEETNEKFDWQEPFRFAVHGKLKSLAMMYSFVLGIIHIFIAYFISNGFALLTETHMADRSVWIRNLISILAPTILTPLLMWGVFALVKNKKLVFWSYVWDMALIVIVLGYTAIRMEQETFALIGPVLMELVGIPVVFGAIFHYLILRVYLKKHPEETG